VRHYGTGANQCTLADRDTTEYGGVRADRRTSANSGGKALPIVSSLDLAVGSCRIRVQVVDEHGAMRDHYFVLNRHAFADEGMTLDLAALADLAAGLYLHESSDPGLVSYFAAVKVYKTVDSNVSAEDNVVGDGLISCTHSFFPL